MSNKIVPLIYRSIIDDVMANIKREFDDYGVGEDVLSDLQSRWENKVVASHVAEFENPAPPQPVTSHHYPPHIQQQHLHTSFPAPYVPPPPPPQPPPPPSPQSQPQPQPEIQSQVQVKSEPIDNRFSTNIPYLPPPSVPALPQISKTQRSSIPATSNPGSSSYSSSNAAPPNGASRTSYYAQTNTPSVNAQTQAPSRIPQVDGPSSSSSDSPSPPPPPKQTFASRASHPSLPQPSQPERKPQPPLDSEEINSDLDDSDTDGEEEELEGNLGETDIVFCTYDKVARVKNKWKCVLKDGMIHVNGKDYLFAKCTCEFEW